MNKEVHAMSVVAVKNKFQIVIPQNIRRQIRVEVGDLLEAGVEDGMITLTPKSLIDRHIAEGLEDLRQGRTHGPYSNAKDAIRALETRARRQAKKRKP
jgi:AbrB family looped-hinge helix DNA binding protein